MDRTVKALAWKSALRRTADASGLTDTAIADGMGVSTTQFFNYLDLSSEVHMPSWRLPAFLLICHGSMAAIEYLAGLQGAVVVRLPAPGSGEVLVLERRRQEVA